MEDSKAFVAETTSHHSGSPSSFSPTPIRASPSYDSDIDNMDNTNFDDALKNPANNRKNNSSSSSSSSSSTSPSSSSDDGGFLSGEEDFETASERPLLADPDDETLANYMEGDTIDVPFVDASVASEFPDRPIAKVSEDDYDDDEDEVVEGLKVRIRGSDEGCVDEIAESPKVRIGVSEQVIEHGVAVVGKEPYVGSSSVTAGIGDSNGKPLSGELLAEDADKVLADSSLGKGVPHPVEELNSVEKAPEIAEVTSNDDLVEANGLKLTTEGDSVVEEVHADFSEPGVVVLGAMEKIKDKESETKGVEVPVDDGVAHEAEGVKLTTEGDSVVEEIHVDVSGSRAVVVGGLEENKELEINDKEVPLDDGGKQQNVSDQTGLEAEQLIDPNLVEGDANCNKNLEPYDDVKTKELDSLEPETEISSIGKEDSTAIEEASVAGTLVEDEQNKIEGAVDGNGVVEGVDSDDKTEKLIGTEVGSKAELKDTMETISADDVEFVATDDGGVEAKELESLKPQTEDNVVIVEDAAPSTMTVGGEDLKTDAADGNQTVQVVDGDDTQKTVIDKEAELKESLVPVAVNEPEFVATEKVILMDDTEISSVRDTNQSNGKVVYKKDLTILGKSHAPLSGFDPEVRLEGEGVWNHHLVSEGDKGPVSDDDTNGMIFESSDAAKQFLEELEQESIGGSHSGAETSRDHSGFIDGQIVTDSDEEVETDEEGDGKELFDSAALAALLKAATGGNSDGSITITSQDGSRLFSVERPAGLGSSIRGRPAPRATRPNIFSSSSITAGGESENNLSEDEKKKMENIQQIRVKYLRLVHRLGQSTEDSVAAQVLYRLGLVGRHSSQSFSVETAKRMALELEASGEDDLNISLNILILGKTGVGKSATINSIFCEEKARIDAFEPTTNAVKEITGVVDGVKIRVFDTPGLRSSVMEQGINRKILASVKTFTKKFPPDIVLYVDRLDSQTRDHNDLPLLKTITSSLGPSIWRSVIVTLTHAASAPPDGPSGSPLSYEVFVSQRSHIVQQSIGQAAGDLRLMNPTFMNPVSLVENHPSCRKNRDGQKVLPNGQTWRPQLLLLCYSMKILSEATSISKPQDPFDPKKLFGFRMRSPSLPYLLSWLLQSRAHPKLSSDQGGDNGDSDIDLDDLSESEGEEEEDEYDQLPPFKPLRKAQIAKLNKEQRKAYFEEYDYRVKLLQKKQWRQELKRMREIKKKGNAGEDDYGYMGDDADQENGAPAAVPVPLPDMVLPPSFDCDNPAYRYRFLEPTSQFLARPVLDTHGWDHDCGYDGVNLEQSLAVAGRFPAAIAIQLTKDKKEFSIHLDSSVSAKHGEDGSTMAGFDIQNIGKQLAYIVRGETKFKNLKKNKTAAGVSVTFLGENIVPGFKIEDQITLGKRLVLVGSTGTVRSQGDAAYGANLEVRLREADFPIGQDQSSLGLSLVKWKGDLALGANLQSQFLVGRGSKVAVRVGLNNKLSGQITVRTSSSDQLQIALVGILPVAMAIYKTIWPGVSENYSMY